MNAPFLRCNRQNACLRTISLRILLLMTLAAVWKLDHNTQLSAQEQTPQNREAGNQSSASRSDKPGIAARSEIITKSFDWKSLDEDPSYGRVCVADLGVALTNSTLAVAINLNNDSQNPIEARIVSSSCGCISNVPQAMKIEPGGAFSHTFKVALPNRPGTYKNEVTFFNEGGICLLQILFKSDVQLPINLPSSLTIEAEDDSKQSISISPSLSHEKLDQYRIRINAPEIVGLEISHEQGSLLSLSPRLNPHSTNTVASVEVIDADGKSSHSSLTLLYPNRILMLPKSISLTPVGDGFSGFFILKRKGIVQSLDAKSLVIKLVDKNNNEVSLKNVESKPISDASKDSTKITFSLSKKPSPDTLPLKLQLVTPSFTYESTCELK